VCYGDISWIPGCLPFCRARSKFGVDSPFHSGGIAAFVPGSQTFEIRETAIFLCGEIFPHTRTVTRPLKTLARLWTEAISRGKEDRLSEGTR
jgi:hypothetical protein